MNYQFVFILSFGTFSDPKLDVGYSYLSLVMQQHQIWTHEVAELGFGILTYHSGLFGLWDLEIQIKVNLQSVITKWPQINEKSIKFWFLIMSGLWFDLHDLHWSFGLFLRSLMPNKSSDIQKSIIRALFHQKEFLLEISHFGSVCIS